MAADNRYQEARKVTLLGALMNAFLGCIKLIGGYLFHSHALIADGVHSFSDLFTDVMVVFASKYGSLDADDSHPYGHQRIETAATFLLALLLILAGGGIAWDALYELFHAASTKPDWLALPVAFVSMLMNEILFRYTRHVGKRIQSSLILANAWHHRSDAAASLVVLLGLTGSLWGFVYLDAVAACIVGCMIIKMGIDYGWNSIKELVDTAVNAEMLLSLEEIIFSIPGVHKIHQLRTRFMGGNIIVDVHIQVSPRISVSEGHYIAQHVHRALIDQVELVKDVTVHVDPEDDEIACPSLHCPNRGYLETMVLAPLRVQCPQIVFFTLHYLEGNIILDVIVDAAFEKRTGLENLLDKILSSEASLSEIRLLTLERVIQR